MNFAFNIEFILNLWRKTPQTLVFIIVDQISLLLPFFSRAIIFIHIEDVDRFAPTFDKPDYEVDMEEDRLYDPLMTLHAHDKDRSKQFKEICDYEIKNPYVPFTIDKNGGFVLYRIPWYMYICHVTTLN